MAEILDQQNIYVDHYVNFYGTTRTAQTFKAGYTGNLTKIILYGSKTGTPPNLIVEIQGVSGGKPDGNILASEEIDVSFVPSSPQEYEIVFSTPTSIVLDSSYAMVMYVKTDGGDSFNSYSFAFDSTSAHYTNGNSWRSFDSGSTWPDIWEGVDHYFKTYVTVFGPVPQIEDIINDFRIAGVIEIEDINNDFRVGGISLEDINNDFRMTGSSSIEDINNDCRTRLTQIDDVNNKITTVALGLDDIINDFRMLELGLSDINNKISFVTGTIEDINNDIRTHKLEIEDIKNDFRMLYEDQKPDPVFPDAGPQSLGKSYITVKINSVDKTSLLDLESLSWTERINNPSTTSFTLGIPYDSGSCPIEGQSIEILYDDRRKFYGYITSISKSSSPDSINIEAQDEYWKVNQTEVEFKVGRALTGDTDTYYTTINEAIAALGFSVNVGNFVPVNMSLTGEKASVISQLIQECGNFGWFTTPSGIKTLWRADEGNIITLERQVIGTNIGLYQVIEHDISEESENVVNKYRVVMGDDIVPGYNNDFRFAALVYKYKLFSSEWLNHFEGTAFNYPANYIYNGKFDRDYRNYIASIQWFDRRKIKDSGVREEFIDIPILGRFKITVPSGYIAGYPLELSQTSAENTYYSHVEPLVGVEWDYDYLSENGFVYYSNVFWTHRGGVYPECRRERSFNVSMGSYAQTIKKDLILSGLNVQYGCNYKVYEGNAWNVSEETGTTYPYTTTQSGYTILEKSFLIPSWNDIAYATDYANYQLSKSCDAKTKGTIKITLDCADIYNLSLNKRIKISGILDTPVNITSITYDINSWLVTISVESFRSYERTVSVPVHERED